MTRRAWGVMLEDDAMRSGDVEGKQDVGVAIVVFHGASILPKLHAKPIAISVEQVTQKLQRRQLRLTSYRPQEGKALVRAAEKVGAELREG